jgi:hypothetical protein
MPVGGGVFYFSLACNAAYSDEHRNGRLTTMKIRYEINDFHGGGVEEYANPNRTIEPRVLWAHRCTENFQYKLFVLAHESEDRGMTKRFIGA